MADSDLASTLTDMIEETAVANGLDVVAVEVAGAENAPLVRVFIDREGGIGIDDLVGANGWIQPILDEVPELEGRYTLEVSSPGVDRPLRRLNDFTRFAGSKVRLTTFGPVGDRKHFHGTIEGVDGEDVLIDIDGTEHRIPHSAVSKARLDADIEILRKD